jgi:hypothetical protein
MGNLTLSAYNSELSTLPFEEKRQLLATSNLQLNAWIAECERWRETEMSARADSLLERALKIWPRPTTLA